MAQKQQKQLMSTLNVLYYADLYLQKHKGDSNWKIQNTYLRCQKRNCPILRLASALSNRNLERAQSRKGSYFKTCTSCKRYWESSSSLKETKKRISHSTTSGRKRPFWSNYQILTCWNTMVRGGKACCMLTFTIPLLK